MRQLTSRVRLSSTVLGILCGLFATQAFAFTHVVQSGDTLAAVAERYYGRVQYEKLLVAANALEAPGAGPIIPGMRLEVPALSYRLVKKGDTWADLAATHLGAKHRADVLAMSNDTSPWLPPVDDTEILIPYNLPVIVGGGETIVSIAYKYLGDMNKAWVLDHYNGLKGRRLQPGDLVLVPLTDLPLTESGKRAVVESNPLLCSQAGGEVRHAQRRVQAELAHLVADVRGGRYVDAISRGSRFLGHGMTLGRDQLALVHRHLLEAYVALDAQGLATASCAEWRKHDDNAKLDPVMMSPKILRACERDDKTKAPQ